jgi:hypothetical protein
MENERTMTLEEAEAAYNAACAACEEAYAVRKAVYAALARATDAYNAACAVRIAADDALTNARAKKESKR